MVRSSAGREFRDAGPGKINKIWHKGSLWDEDDAWT